MALPQFFQANPKVALVATIAAVAADAGSAAFDITGYDRMSSLDYNLSAFTGTAVVFYLEHSPDGGQTWLRTGLATSSLTATGSGSVSITRDLFPLIRIYTDVNSATVTAKFWIGHNRPGGNLPKNA